MTTAKLNATGMRWVNGLSEYDFTLKYRPGKSAADADGLSRNPLPAPDVVSADLSTPSIPSTPPTTPNSCKSLPITELQRECTITINREDLNQILSPPEISHCQSVDINISERNISALAYDHKS